MVKPPILSGQAGKWLSYSSCCNKYWCRISLYRYDKIKPSILGIPTECWVACEISDFAKWHVYTAMAYCKVGNIRGGFIFAIFALC